jgi:polar amino acid transport system permease protein
MSDSEVTSPEPGRPVEDIKAVPVRRPGRWIAAFIVVVVAASIVRSIVTNENFQWGTVWHFLGDPRLLHGIVVTLYLTALSMVIGVVLGVLLAVMRLSPNPIVKGASWLYIFFFRGTPLLVQIIFWFNISALFQPGGLIGLGVPFGPDLVHLNANSVITPIGAALLALGLNEGAYMAEIVRAGIISVDEGQSEAASSLGMGRLQTMRHVVLPQAMRVILPPTGNETISMLKNTALASVIAVPELLFAGQGIYSSNFQTIPLLIDVSIWYLLMTSVAYVGQFFLERNVSAGFSRHQQATMRERWLSFGARGSAGGVAL